MTRILKQHQPLIKDALDWMECRIVGVAKPVPIQEFISALWSEDYIKMIEVLAPTVEHEHRYTKFLEVEGVKFPIQGVFNTCTACISYLGSSLPFEPKQGKFVLDGTPFSKSLQLALDIAIDGKVAGKLIRDLFEKCSNHMQMRYLFPAYQIILDKAKLHEVKAKVEKVRSTPSLPKLTHREVQLLRHLNARIGTYTLMGAFSEEGGIRATATPGTCRVSVILEWY